jgi:hypothetical protein
MTLILKQIYDDISQYCSYSKYHTPVRTNRTAMYTYRSMRDTVKQVLEADAGATASRGNVPDTQHEHVPEYELLY